MAGAFVLVQVLLGIIQRLMSALCLLLNGSTDKGVSHGHQDQANRFAATLAPTGGVTDAQDASQVCIIEHSSCSLSRHDVLHAHLSVHGYGYGGRLSALRDQFPQLAGLTYLDHAAATLYAEPQIRAAADELVGALFANPHSQLDGALDASCTAVQQLRLLTLGMLNAPPEEYEVRIKMHLSAVALAAAGVAFDCQPCRGCLCPHTEQAHGQLLLWDLRGLWDLPTLPNFSPITGTCTADTAQVILTGGATSALKLAAEAFPWSRKSCCAVCAANHNSSLGIRQLAAAAGAALAAPDLMQLAGKSTALLSNAEQPLPRQELLQQLRELRQQQQYPCTQQQQQQQQQQHADEQCPGVGHSLLVVPAECNFSGRRYDCAALLRAWLKQQEQACSINHQEQQQQQQRLGTTLPQATSVVNGVMHHPPRRWWLLVDAAKACASHPPDCSDGVIDMLALSYYKIFGSPTGVPPSTPPHQ
jgi:hypothetical protein